MGKPLHCVENVLFNAQVGCASTGFVGEMRAVAMKLHTREQAPKEGGVEAPKRAQAVRIIEGWS